MLRRVGRALAAIAILALADVGAPAVGLAQPLDSGGAASREGIGAVDSFVTVVPGPQFNQGRFFRFFWGTDYRREWNTPVRVPVLDLGTFGGGLRPVAMGEPGQSLTLYLEGADGRRYAFRSIVKSLAGSIPGVVLDSPLGTVLEDLNSALHPAAQMIADSLEAGTDILHSHPLAVVMPDVPGLGEFRKPFGGLLGTIEPIAAEGMIGSDELFTRVQRSPDDRVDSRALLAARLIDIFVGDWNRDRHQWRWVRDDVSGKWLPIAVDRDEAFVRMDGLFPSVMHFFWPPLAGFKKTYPSITDLTYTGQELDRRFLVDLERPTWDSVATRVADRLTRNLIEGAVRQQPPAMYAIGGDRLVSDLVHRQEALVSAAADFYGILAGEVEVFGTDVAETAWITGLEDGSVEVALAAGSVEEAAYFRRRFHPDETHEIRLRLGGGNDLAMFGGDPRYGVRVRILGGPGDDEFRFLVPARHVKLYDQDGEGRVTGEAGGGKKVDRRTYREWRYSPTEPIPPRHWGSRWTPAARIQISSDYGLFVGLGAERRTYAFRKDPYSTRLQLLGGISTDGKVAVGANYDTRFENSRTRIRTRGGISQLTQTHFYGFGNATLNPPEADSDFFDVDRTLYYGDVAVARFPMPSEKIDAAFGVQLSLSVTGENEGRYISLFPDLYGVDDFGQIGLFLDFDMDTRDFAANPTKGAHVYVRGTSYPSWLSADQAFLPLDLFGAFYVTPQIPLHPTLAFRVGSRVVWGAFPYFEAAYIGGVQSLRGWASQRFAGDASLYGGMDLRVKLLEIKRFLPGPFGMLGLIDVGRVWFDGESRDGFHVGYGGGIWTGFLGRGQTVSVSVAGSEEQLSVYLGYGFAF